MKIKIDEINVEVRSHVDKVINIPQGSNIETDIIKIVSFNVWNAIYRGTLGQIQWMFYFDHSWQRKI